MFRPGCDTYRCGEDAARKSSIGHRDNYAPDGDATTYHPFASFVPLKLEEFLAVIGKNDCEFLFLKRREAIERRALGEIHTAPVEKEVDRRTNCFRNVGKS